MGQAGRRQAGVNEINLTLNGGLNYSQSVASIADNELTRAYNMIYDPETDKLITRPGTQCVTTVPLTAGIDYGCYYKATATVGYHIAVSDGKLWSIGGAATTYTQIATLTSASTIPSMVTFNGKLIVADGGTELSSWDGTTYAAITTSPDATALHVAKNRIVANSVSEPDSVYLSAPNDETDWDTTGTAVGLKAGYGDLLNVNAFSSLNDDIIISKYGTHARVMYRLNVASGEPASWYCLPFSQSNAAYNNRSMINAYNNVFFLDTNGFKSVKNTSAYGDLAIDVVGRKVNNLFEGTSTINGAYYTPKYNAVWFMVSNNVVCYTERVIEGTVVPAFTVLYFSSGQVTSMYEVSGVLYITSKGGHLYYLDADQIVDELTTATSTSFISRLRTKLFTFNNDIVLRKLKYFINPISTCSGNIWAAKNDTDKALLGTFGETAGTQEYVYDATEKIDDATGAINLSSNEPNVRTLRNRKRDYEMGFEFECISGRFGLDWIKAEYAQVDGGE